jgi:hypothetical protein
MAAIGFGALGGVLGARGLPPEAAPVPIAILDRGALLQSLESQGNPEEHARQRGRFESLARQLADAGYLVIDRGWVIAAPEDFYVDPPQ